jgi:hypothetical protein
MEYLTSEQERLITGEAYRSALTEQQLLLQEIVQLEGKGFKSQKECAEWAHDHVLDNILYQKHSASYLFMSHEGKPLSKNAYDMEYKNILFSWEQHEENAKPTKKHWVPNGFLCMHNSKVTGEKPEDGKNPMYHRNHYLPTGYYDKSKGSYNIAKPISAFAKPITHRDTSHIYKYIEHVAGECAPYLLAWLRTKLLNVHQKTEITPIFISRTQGTGKTTFAEVICRGLFGVSNVVVTDKYSRKDRFNADVANALVICKEETDYNDKRNSEAEAKNDATNNQVRVEIKGQDPYYQDSYTEFIMTSNRDVPLKFEGPEDQRRFMIMQADESFTRGNPEADEVFTKLYGFDIATRKPVGVGFVDDKELQEQFIYELIYNKQLMELNPKDFPRTSATQTAKTMARTNEATEVESIMRSLVPFVKLSLEKQGLVTQILSNDEKLFLSSFISSENGIQYFEATDKTPAHVAICRPLVFSDVYTGKALPYALVERCLYDCNAWLKKEYGLQIESNMKPLQYGFKGLNTRFRYAAAARIISVNDATPGKPGKLDFMVGEGPKLVAETVKLDGSRHIYDRNDVETKRKDKTIDPNIPQRFRVDENFNPDPYGVFETINPMLPGTTSLANKTNNVATMEFFLFESDEVSPRIAKIEQERLDLAASKPSNSIHAKELFAERLMLQTNEINRLCNEGKVYRAVSSGCKSIHITVRVKDAPTTAKEYKWLHAHLANTISSVLDFDPTCADPARLTRSPVSKLRKTMYHGVTVTGMQSNLYYNEYSILDINWRPLYEQWLNRPKEAYEFNRKLMPCKPVYKEAMEAMLYGTFFTDHKWDGNRNGDNVFFAAYRLCRRNFTHEQLWSDEGILCDLDGYYKPNEIPAWRRLEKSDIIRQIDEDMDYMNEVEDGYS